MLRKSLLALAAIAAILGGLNYFLHLPQSSIAASQAMRLPVDPAPLVVTTSTGEHAFQIEIADDSSERSAGLMFRETMDDDHGMLFVFEQSRPVSFWMRNTPMPLDLVFIDANGAVRDILPGEPFSETPIGPAAPVKFVLELKRGMADMAGIKPGDAVRHPAIGVAGSQDPG